MMNLFSSFNPVTSKMTSLNWIIIMVIIPMMLTSYWKIMSPMNKSNSMFNYMSSIMFKSSIPKIHLPNMTQIVSLMMMIFFLNFISLLPHNFSVTSHLIFNLCLSISLWMSTMIYKINNIKKMMTNLTPPYTPIILMPFMVIIEMVSLMIQPLTLSIRLTANIMAGHIMLILISHLYTMYFLPSLIMNLVMLIMELLVAIIQAYVFTMLISMYSK